MAEQKYNLYCPECCAEFDITKPQTFCAACASPIMTRYYLETVKRTLTKEALASRPRGLWRWHELLPAVAAEKLRQNGLISQSENVVLFNTGTGLKYIQ